MNIDRIYINTHRYDLFFTRMCVASIRYWYPEIPISLIIDHSAGEFVPPSFLRKWNLELFENDHRGYGWGFGKFEPLFLPYREKFLVLDADTAFIGPVLDVFEGSEADFIVDKEVQPLELVPTRYYDLDSLRTLFPDYRYPGYTFNTGQWAGTGGIISKRDFDPLLYWEQRPRLKYPASFSHADQGIFNFLLQFKEQESEITVDRVPLMIWPDNGNGDFIDLENIRKKQGDYRCLVHWAGMKFERIQDFPRADILDFYYRYYLSRYTGFKDLSDTVYLFYLKNERRVKAKLESIKKKSG